MKTFAQFYKTTFFQHERSVIWGIFFLITFLYYQDTLHNWFFYDDPAAIVWSTEPFRDIIFSVNYSPSFYTPLVALSFKPDVILFGLNPFPYHVHNVIILVCIAFVVFKIIRLYADTTSSALAAMIIIYSTPSLVCLSWIVLRQYLYPMLFSLTSVYLFLKYQPLCKHKRFLVLILLVLSELSFMGKEQFMTLPFILLLIADGNLKEKIARTYLFFIILSFHFLLRIYVLDGWGGYEGVHYNPWNYMKTVFQSILRTSTVLFGHPWFIVVIAAPLLVFRPKKILLAFLVWVFSLLISFLSLDTPPHADSFRYWLIPVSLFSVFTGLNASFIRDTVLRKIYLIVIIVPFLVHSLIINNEMKAFFRSESLTAKRVTDILRDKKYQASAFLYPDDFYLLNAPYVEYMLKAYRQIGNTVKLNSFFPLEFIAFFPEIKNDYESIYMIKNDEPMNIYNSIEEKSAAVKSKTLSQKRLGIDLHKTGNRTELTLSCESGKQLIAFKKLPFGDSVTKQTLPYFEYVNLNPYIKLMKSRDAEILSIDLLSYHQKKWNIGGKQVNEETSFYIFTCIDNEGKSTAFSDILSFIQ